MSYTSALSHLREAIESGKITQTEVAQELGMHPSQVSRIVRGDFVRLGGHALSVCKFAQSYFTPQCELDDFDLATRISELGTHLARTKPHLAQALIAMLEDLSQPNETQSTKAIKNGKKSTSRRT